MYFRVYCARITPIMFNNLSTYNLDELVKPLPFLIESSDDIYLAGIDSRSTW